MARAGSDLSQYIRKLNKVHSRVIKGYIDDYIIEYRRYIKGRIKVRLWTKGQSGDGSILPPYSEAYRKFKKSKGLRQSPTSLNLTGDWYDSMYMYIDSVKYNHIIEVRTRSDQADKTKALKRKYGASILTLLPSEQKDVADLLNEYVQKRIDTELDGKIILELY